ncbi:GNAT family N-acetyltransferase [Fodinicurvata sp. EGI_FJ10296]|uniref:GNAT family N-acetyltransferase n=1 Tax=Fodinicurvata sp. EGI_FJ10296 TaxID=3231908 RepID=UPI003455B24C
MPDSTATIRPATPADIPEILRMIRDLARFEKAEDEVRVTADDLMRDGWGPSPRFEVLMADADGEAGGAVGFCLFFHNYSTWEGRAGLYVEDLYVDPDARKGGYGQALLAAVARLAIERDCRRVDLSALDWNPARRFYDRLGFAEKTEWVGYRLTGEALRRLADGAPQASIA